MASFSLWIVCLCWFIAVFAAEQETTLNLNGPNVCTEQEVSQKKVNISTLTTASFLEYELCFNIPPKCPKWVTKHMPKWREETIERVINVVKCCQGYQVTGSTCSPVCTQSCLNGKCVEPETCACLPGFSGKACNLVGCPNGNWGPDCSQPCNCENDGHCEPTSGLCQCLPGYEGLHCQKKCSGLKYGQGCAKKCKCGPGSSCHHVTGECINCPQGTYGQDCAQNCECAKNGTALCFHENGNCFCQTNFYGRLCEMHCPFGYLNGKCLQEMQDGECNCASDLYRCDSELGCVCKDGLDCEGGTQIINFASLSNQDPNSSNSSLGLIVALVIILAIIMAILVAIYYRRRMRRLKDDLQNRSVKYIENSMHSPLRDMAQKHDLVVTNADPYLSDNDGIKNLPNNATAIHMPSGSGSQAGRPEKNTNIDNFKLGKDELLAEAQGTPRAARSWADGACRIDPDEVSDNGEEPEDIPFHHEPADINVYQEFSPTKERNNAKLADLNRKLNKPNVNVILNNVRDTDSTTNSHSNQRNDEDPKLTVRLKHNNL
ncbi:hypothetical protein TCAL_02952 [Tigriopus californicus]|uniref:EMI domain-containing protein n=1 Tax=Tigriopus californicus TaxID=6832 RepID=A0A553NNY2_TIGCA|nr:multiple epidermal growth factor-like domains protein 10 [Tigriopus californicus]TRY67148.1 hypothetical protein TCAL_02952 [Tigriopus californicus]|eukprot:TCALIF_02952-PA protein Name:"Similar to Megf11 Multiple epidermal growth factor-like domains protein 11 (Mus musculus)" AED:0.03 eAED:0.03 QI:0/-1/0/1/-1/1/1/0/545